MADKIRELWPVLFRAGLYFTIAFIGILAEKVGPILEKDQWPSAQRWVLAALIGTGSGLWAVRAYFDGSAQRAADAKKNGTGTPH